jgi:hypothetical protein
MSRLARMVMQTAGRADRAPERECSRLSGRLCDGCGASFTPVRDWHRHCSDRCRARSNRERKAREVQETIDRLKRLTEVDAVKPME